MLADALRSYRWALSASLWAEYQIDLESPPFGPLRLAEFMAALPPGCAFWRAVGGPMAWTVEQHTLAAVEFRLKALEYQGAGQRGPKPKALQHPPYSAAKTTEQEVFDRRARLFRERFG